MKDRRYSLRALAVGLGLALFLGACSAGNDDTDTLGTNPYVTEGGTERIFAEFEPGQQVMPLPNDLVWLDDGTPEVSFAITEGDPLAGLKQAINAQELLGLSPNMFLTVPVTGDVDADTVELLAFRTDDPQLPALLGALATGNLPAAGAALAQMELRTEADFVCAAEGTVLKLLPKQALTPGVAYAVALKRTLVDAQGYLVSPSLAMSALKSTEPFGPEHPFYRLEPLRAKFNDPNLTTGAPGLLDVIGAVTAVRFGQPWTRPDLLVAWTFHTAALTLSAGGTLPYGAFGEVTGDLKGFSAFLWGTGVNAASWLDDLGNPSEGPAPVTLPALYGDYATDPDLAPVIGYVLSTAPADPDPETATNEADPVDLIYFGQFQSPDVASILAGDPVPTAVPFLLVTPRHVAPPYPVVVFQHGILRDKFDALLTARAFAAQGLATLAIDAPYHGWRKQEGKDFLSPDLGQTRLNAYQAALDLWETFDVIEAGAVDFEGDPEVELDDESPRFAAESLGSLLGSVFLSQDTRPVRIHLASPAAQVANVLDESHKPEVADLVASFGTKGTTPYYVFLNIAQWLLDPVDSMYNGIGDNETSKLMAVAAYGDPIVSELSTRTFLSSIGVESIATLAPPFADPSTDPGAYRYGTPPAETQVIHFFTLAPFFDPAPDEEPWYTDYVFTVQAQATAAAQAQAAVFLEQAPPPVDALAEQ